MAALATPEISTPLMDAIQAAAYFHPYAISVPNSLGNRELLGCCARVSCERLL
jgi:hypothetical protein